MSPLEVAGLLVAGISGIALPLLAARATRINSLELKVAKLETASETWHQLHLDLRGMRDDIQEMAAALARLEGSFVDRK